MDPHLTLVDDAAPVDPGMKNKSYTEKDFEGKSKAAQIFVEPFSFQIP